MNNYENQKERIDAILNNNSSIAVDRETNKATECNNLACSKCLFSNTNYACCISVIKWLLAEYKEPEVDWSDVPIDTPVLVSDNGEKWYRRYFAGVIDEEALVYSNGGTSWSVGKDGETSFRYIKLAEVE